MASRISGPIEAPLPPGLYDVTELTGRPLVGEPALALSLGNTIATGPSLGWVWRLRHPGNFKWGVKRRVTFIQRLAEFHTGTVYDHEFN